MIKALKDYGSRLLNILYPKTCIGCNADLAHDDVRYSCQKCWNSIEKIGPLHCWICSRPLDYGGRFCFECRGKHFPFKRIAAAVRYTGIMRTYVHMIKFRRRSDLLKPFRGFLSEALKTFVSRETWDMIIPVPLHRSRLRERGFNQSEILAEMAAEASGIPLVTDYLVRRLNTEPQYLLSKKDRKQNLYDAFSIRSRHDRASVRSVILVDDICTSRATIEACSITLRKAGIKVIYGLVLARD
jgi:competence protein ComFC